MAVVLSALVVGTGTPVAAHQPVDGTPRVSHLQGLRPATSGRCAGGYRIVGSELCTHGPDARPAGDRLATQLRSVSATGSAGLPSEILCDGDGVSGRRVQAIYARTAATPSRRSKVMPQIRKASVAVQSAFLASAARTDGVRRPRWVTDVDCQLRVIEVVLSEAARTNFGTTTAELRALGHGRADRKYLIWFDTQVYCGIGTFWGDDRPTADNMSNTTVGYGRIDTGCWGWSEAHELMHTLGAVQDSAPNSTFGEAPNAGGHCTDEYDVMCYADAAGVRTTVRCPDHDLDGLFDCGNNDYFDTDPRSGSYLGTHWNTADSGWLERSVKRLAVPVPTLDVGGTVVTGRVPVAAAGAAAAPAAGVDAVDTQRRVGTGSWQDVDVSAADAADGRLKVGAATQYRVRAIDGSGGAGPWRLGPTVTPTMRDDRHGSLRWSTGWRADTIADALGGSLRRSTKAGSTVRLTTSVRQVGIVAGRGPLAGRLEIRVDGKRVRIVDLSADRVTQRSIAAVVTLGSGRHTLELRVLAPRTATPGWRVDVDAMALLAR